MTWWVSSGGMIASIVWGVWLASVLEYLQISWEVYAIFAGLLFLDFIFWIADAFFEDRQKVTSSAAYKWIFKKFSKLILPAIFVLAMRWIWAEDTSMLTTTIMSILIITESYSIIW